MVKKKRCKELAPLSYSQTKSEILITQLCCVHIVRTQSLACIQIHNQMYSTLLYYLQATGNSIWCCSVGLQENNPQSMTTPTLTVLSKFWKVVLERYVRKWVKRGFSRKGAYLYLRKFSVLRGSRAEMICISTKKGQTFVEQLLLTI